MIELQNVSKIYSQEGHASVGIRKINLKLDVGEFVAITGESGSGKTTLLNVISGIDTYEEGEMYVNGEVTSSFTIKELEEYRNKYVGFIFQNYNIIDSYTVKQNVEAALILNNYPTTEISKKAKELIEKVGLTHRMKTKASKLSGGEKQRVVIARALAKNPLIIAADEPTGNLDSQTSKQIIELLHEISKDRLVLIVTHDFEEVERYATRKIRIFDGEIKEDVILQPKEEQEEHPLPNVKSTKTNFFKMIPFGVNNLMASPKRSIFNVIVYFIMCLMVVFSFTFNAYRIKLETTPDAFLNNQDRTRLQVKRNDNKPFTTEELTTLKNLDGVESLVKYNLFQNCLYHSQMDEFNIYDIDTILRPLSSLKGKPDYGTLPKDEGEAILACHSGDIDEGKFEKLVNQTIFESIYSYSGSSMNTYKVTGVCDVDNYGVEHPTYLYIQDSQYEKLAIQHYRYSYYNRVLSITHEETDESSDQEPNNLYYTARVFSSDELEGNDFYYNFEYQEYETLPEIDDQSYHYQLTIKDYIYGDIESFSLTPKGFLTKEQIQLHDKEKEAYYYFGDYTNYYRDIFVFVSPTMYEKIFSHVEDCYEIALYTKTERDIQGVKNKLAKLNYLSISMKDAESVSALGTLASFGYGLLLLLFLTSTFFFVFAIMNHSVRSRRSDLEILRTIGATKENITMMLISEYVMCGIIGYILSIITFLLLRAYAFKDLRLFLAALLPGHFFLIFLVVIVITTLMSLLFAKLLFRKSVQKGLMGARRS